MAKCGLGIFHFPLVVGQPPDFAQCPAGVVTRLPNRDLLERLGAIAGRLGTRSFLVGGPVRDLILGLPSPDLDVAVEDRSREFGTAVAKEFGGRFVYHSRFLTGSVLSPLASRLSPLAHIDITQTRTETYPRPAVLPQVKPASIVADLARRDFSINAMALEITPDSFGTFIDPYHGRDDLACRRVRILHDRSFVDDPTRIFRCIRFAIRFGSAIEPDTLELLRRAIEQRYPALLTPERILYELRLVCGEPLVLPMVEALIHERVLEAAWRWTPPRGFLAGIAKLARECSASLGTRSESSKQDSVMSLRSQSPDFAQGFRPADLLFIYFLSVLPVTDRFPIRKEERDAAEAVAGFTKLKHTHKLKPSEIYQALRDQPETALMILAALEPQPVARHIKTFLGELRHVSISVTGADLRAAGLKPGPAFREILDKLLFARLDGRIRTVADEHALLRRLAARQKDA